MGACRPAHPSHSLPGCRRERHDRRHRSDAQQPPTPWCRFPTSATTAARTRIGIVARNLANDDARGEALRATLIALAMQDAYAAHDLLRRPNLARQLTTSQSDALHDLVRACGLRRGTIPRQLRDQLMAAVARSADTLAKELAPASFTDISN